MDQKFDYIELLIEDLIATIVLNRPNKRNALHVSMIEELATAIQICEQQDDLILVVIRSSLESHGLFSAGIDLINLGQLLQTSTADQLNDLVDHIQDQYDRIANCNIPTLAVLDGLCLGAAMELAIACDFRIGTDQTVLALNETEFGLVPDLGGITRLIRLVGEQVTKRLVLLGEKINAEQAIQLGVLDWICEDPDEKIEQLGQLLRRNHRIAVQYAKELINTSSDVTRQTSFRNDKLKQLKLLKTGAPLQRMKHFKK